MGADPVSGSETGSETGFETGSACFGRMSKKNFEFHLKKKDGVRDGSVTGLEKW